MRSLFFVSVLSVCLFSACNQSDSKSESKEKTASNQTFDLDTTKLQAGEVFYQCPMHPEVLSDQAGQCPKCEMDLEPVTKS